MVSSEAITALKPVVLAGDAHWDSDESSSNVGDTTITWATAQGGAVTIRAQEVITVVEVPGGAFLIVTLSEQQQQQQSTEEEGKGPQPFTLLSFLAPSSPASLLLRDGDDQWQQQAFLPLPAVPAHIRVGPDATLDVLVSGRAGTGLAAPFYDAVVRPLLGLLGLAEAAEGRQQEQEDETGLAVYRVTTTRDAETIKEFARARWGAGPPPSASSSSSSSRGRSEKKKRETVILLSGDGGIVDLLSATPPSSSSPEGEKEQQQEDIPTSSPLPTVVVLPLGTGNALFHSLHKPHYSSQKKHQAPPSPLILGLRALLRGRPAPLPTFQASFHPAAHPVVVPSLPITAMTGAIVASYGFHAQLVWESDTPAYRAHGAQRFGMAAEALLGESHAYHAVVETTTTTTTGTTSSRVVPGKVTATDNDDKKTTTRFNYVLTTLCSNLEKTFTISPASEPLDGVLRLVHFGGADGKRTMEIMGAAYDGGRHVGMEDVGYEAVQQVKVTTLEEDARWRKVCIDGTILELPEEGSMTVTRSLGERLQVVVLDP